MEENRNGQAVRPGILTRSAYVIDAGRAQTTFCCRQILVRAFGIIGQVLHVRSVKDIYMDKEVSIVQYLPYHVLLYSCKISLHLDTTLSTI
jgi:hypothetical protein